MRRPPTITHSWRVTWHREGWQYPHTRYFELKYAARRHAKKLLGDGRPDLAPLTFVRLERRPVGAWEEVRL